MVAEVLGLEHVSVLDNFFHLGGHSLSAMQVLTRIHALFDLDLSLGVLFADPTVAAIAQQIDQAHHPFHDPGDPSSRSEATAAPAYRIPRVDRTQPLRASSAQERLWFLNQWEGESATYNLPFALNIRGPLDRVALERCLTQILQRHESLRTSFHLQEDCLTQIIHPHLPLPLQFVSLEAGGLTLAQWMQQAAQTPFDLEQEPLLRVTLLALTPTEHVLLLTLHHTIADAWSMGSWSKKSRNSIPNFVQDKRHLCPRCPYNMQTMRLGNGKQLTAADFQQRLHDWSQRFIDAPSVLTLPTDRPRPAQQTFRGALIRSEISPS